MLFVESTQDIGLDDREPLAGPVLEIVIDFLLIEPLEEQPGGITQVEEGLAVLIHEVAPVRADLESQVFDRALGRFWGTGAPGRVRGVQRGEQHAAREYGEGQGTNNEAFH